MTLLSPCKDLKKGKVFVATQDALCVIKLVGDIRVTLCNSMDDYIENVFVKHFPYKNILIDLTEAEAIDSTSLGLLAKISLYAQQNFSIKPTIISPVPSITKLLMGVGFNQIFNIETKLEDCCGSMEPHELAVQDGCSENEVKKRVIEAHKILMSLNNENKNAFRELVSNLEQES